MIQVIASSATGGLNFITGGGGPQGPVGPGTADTVLLTPASQAALQLLSIDAQTVDQAIIALVNLLATNHGLGGDSDMSEAGNPSETVQ